MRVWFFILFVLLVLSNGFWVYSYVNLVVSHNYLQSSYSSEQKKLDTLLHLSGLFLLGENYDNIAEKIEASIDFSLVEKKPDVIFVDSFVFVFKNKLLTHIKEYGDLSEEELDRLTAQ